MNNEARDELISAALDGERVDVEALRAALVTPDGRASLAAFVLLRAATADDDIAPARRYEELAAVTRRRSASRLVGARVPAAWAASIAILAIASSFWFGTAFRAPSTSLTLVAPPSVASPTQAPTILMVPTGVNLAGRGPTEAPKPAGRPRVIRVVEQPPKPTRMLRFVPGVDWISATQ